VASLVTRYHPETGNSADEIWKLELKGLATTDEIRWRRREDARTDTERPAKPKPRYKPMSPDEWDKATYDGSSTSFGGDGYQSYLKGFYQEMGRLDAHDR